MSQQAIQLCEEAKLAYEASNYQSAADMFLEASHLFEADHDTLMAAEMANNRSVALLQAGEAQAALDACLGTERVFSEAGDKLREGLALGNQAAAYKELGLKKESLRLFRLSASKLEETGDKENLAIVHKTIAALQMETGDNLGAMSAMLDALRTKEKLTMREKFLRWLFSVASRMMPK